MDLVRQMANTSSQTLGTAIAIYCSAYTESYAIICKRSVKLGMHLRKKYELFNYRHSSLRNIVERTFGVFKRRWRVYDRAPEFDTAVQVKLVYVLVAVHNHINHLYSVLEDYEQLKPYLREAAEMEQRREAQILAEIGGFDSAMGDRRDKITDELWGDYATIVLGLM